jgi:hypothetical protein
MARSGWFADPLGRHEKRFHNGLVWTDRVVDGNRTTSDPIGNVSPRAPFELGYAEGAPSKRAARPPPTSNGPAAAALILGVIGSVAASLSPFGFFVGAACGLIALNFGLRGRRNSRRGAPANGFAIAGVVLGSLALVVAVYYGSTYYSLTDTVHRAFASSPHIPVADANVARDKVHVTACYRAGGMGAPTAAGTLVNTARKKQSFRVTIAFHVGPITVRAVSTTPPLAPGARASWTVRDLNASFEPTSCTIVTPAGKGPEN